MDFREIMNRMNFSEWPRRKKLVVGAACALMLLICLIAVSIMQLSQEEPLDQVTLMPNATPEPKDLEYDFIKVDTIAITNFPRNEAPQPIAEKPATREPERKRKTTVFRPQKKSAPAPKTTAKAPMRVNKNPNMIVHNTIGKSDGSPDASALASEQATLVKVVLPDRTPVANGSLVEARVVRDAQWGELTIPRRTRMIGIASMFNRRVNIDFRQIILEDDNRSLSGRAYDLKRLQGLPYSPVNSETRRILLDELRDATLGVPIVGRVAQRSTLSNNLNQDVSELEEGLEFYVLINSIR